MTSLQSQLEADLLRNPEDRLTHMAYGDYLAEQGEPRGELIQVQLALEDGQRLAWQREELRRREGELLDRHWRQLLGPLADYVADRHTLNNRVQFRRGWLDSIRLGLFDTELAHALVRTPNLQLLRSLRLIDTIPHRPAEGLDPAEALQIFCQVQTLPHLRSLSLGDHEGDAGFRSFSWPQIQGVLQGFSHVEELNLNVRDAENQLLGIDFPSLKVLRLDRFRLGDQGLVALMQAEWFSQLKILQIWNGHLTDSSVYLLLPWLRTHPLHLLDLSFNWLSESALQLLQEVCEEFRAEYQLTPETDVEYLDEQPVLYEDE